MPRPVDPGQPVKPTPPKYPPKTPPTDTTVPQYARAVIAMVDDVNKPTVATVYVDNSLPAEDGYKIPTSLGMKFVEAPSAWSSTTAYNPGDLTELNGAAYQCLTANTNSQPPNANWTTPTGIAFYNNTVTMKGGSWCDVDTYNKVISRIEQGESNGPPSNPSDLFQFIQHNGAYNTTGNFVNPGPIDTTQLLIGSLNVTPNITGVGTVSKSSSGAGTTDFMITGFTVDSVGTTASKWLNAIYCVSSVHNANNWSLCGHISPGSTGNYGGVWGGIGSGILPYDLGIVYVDLSGNVSNVGTLWANQQPNTLNSGLASLPGGPPPFTVTSANVVYTAINSTSYSISIPFTITSNVPGAAAGIAAWMTLHGQNAIAYNIGILPIGNNTITTPAIPDSTQTYDVYLAWVDAAGNKGQSLIVYTTSAYTAAAPGSGGTMPSNTSALTSLSGVQVVTYSGSGSGSGSTLGKALSFGGGSNASGTGVIEWTITEDSTQNAQLWNNGLRLVYANPLVAYLQAPVSSGATSVTIPWYGNSNDPSVGNTVLLFAGWPTGNKGYYLSQTPSDIVTISSVGTPSQLNGITVNTITFGTALTGSYSGVESFLCTVPRQTDWVEAGRLPWNNTSTYTGVWDCLPGSLFAAQVVDFSNNNSTVTNSDISVIMFNPVKRMKITQGPSLALTVPNVVSNAGFTYANSGNGAYDAIDTVTLDAVATVGGPVSAVEMLVSSAYFSDTIAAVSSGGAVLTLTAADAKVKIGQQVAIDTGSLTEYNIVTDVSGTSVTLAFNLSNSHGANTSVTFSSWTHYGYIPVVQANSSNQGVYSCEWVSLGAGTAYTLGLRYVDHNNNTSYAASIGTTVANPLTNTALPTMPAGAAISVSGVTEVIYESGMHTILTNVTGFAPMVEVSFTLGDTNNPLATTWGDHFVGYIRQTGTTSWASVPQVPVPASSLTNGSTQNVKFHITPGYNYDFGVLLADKQGNLTNGGTPVSLGTNYSIPKVQNGNPIGPIWGIGHFLGDTSGDTTTTIVDGGNRRFLHPVMSAPVQGTLQSTLNGASYLKSGVIDDTHIHSVKLDTINDGTTYARVKGTELATGTVKQLNDGAGNIRTVQHIVDVINNNGGHGQLNVSPAGGVTSQLPQVNHDPTVLLSSVTGNQRNLVPDSDFKFQQTYWSAVNGASFGSGNGTFQISGTYGYFDGVPVIQFLGTGAASGYALVASSKITVRPNTNYTLSATINAINASAGGPLYWYAYDATGAVNYSSPIGGAAINHGTRGRTSLTFTTGASTTAIIVAAGPGNATITAGYTVEFYWPQLELGNSMTAYRANIIDDLTGSWAYGTMSSDYQGNFDSSGQAKASTMLKDQGSIAPSAIPGVSIAASNSSGNCTVTISWSAGTIYFSDGSTITISASSWSQSSLSASTTYHYGVYADVSGTIHILGNYGPNTSPTTQQRYAIYLDFRYGISEDTYVTTPASSGGGGTGGGGGGGGSCPSVDQVVLTKERGYIPAGECASGMHLMGPDGEWKQILKTQKRMGPLFNVEVDGERYEVDYNHYWMDADGDFVRVTDLTMDTLLKGHDGRLHRIEAIAFSRIGEYMMIRVDGAIFRIGKLIAHNVITQ